MLPIYCKSAHNSLKMETTWDDNVRKHDTRKHRVTMSVKRRTEAISTGSSSEPREPAGNVSRKTNSTQPPSQPNRNWWAAVTGAGRRTGQQEDAWSQGTVSRWPVGTAQWQLQLTSCVWRCYKRTWRVLIAEGYDGNRWRLAWYNHPTIQSHVWYATLGRIKKLGCEANVMRTVNILISTELEDQKYKPKMPKNKEGQNTFLFWITKTFGWWLLHKTVNILITVFD